MSARAWETRRTKRGLAARCYPRIERLMRRDKDKPLPRTYRGRGPGGLRLTVTVGPPDDFDRDDYWED